MSLDVTLTADMPIQQNHDDRAAAARGKRLVRVTSLPAGMFDAASKQQCQRTHSQTLDKIRRRGGFGAAEAVCALACIPAMDWMPPKDEAHRILYVMRALYRRQPQPEPAPTTP